jgi:hypothetical protein
VNKYLRVFIMVAVLLVTVGLAQNRVVWAQPSTQPDQSVQFQGVSSAPQPDVNSDKDGGTVKPPPSKIKIGKNGNYSIGGVSTLTVKDLAPDYRILASLKKAKQAPKYVPSDVGQILADVTVIQFIYRNHHVSQLPVNKGTVELCYAIPPGKNASLYFLNEENGTWQPLETTVAAGTACSRVQASGSYALIGK